MLGVLLRGGDVLERSRMVDTVIFDKTGILTTGKMTLRADAGAAGPGRRPGAQTGHRHSGLGAYDVAE